MSTTVKPGQFCWWDLATTDQKAAESFYTSLFGWSVVESPMGPDAYYTMFMLGDKTVCGAAQQGPDQAGTPPHWTSYILVENVDETAAKVTAAGGTVVFGPIDVMTQGRMLIVQGPAGAFVGFWQAGEHGGAGSINELWSNCWNELYTPDVAVSQAFYTAVLGWTFERMPMPDMEYWTIKLGDSSVGGMMPITEQLQGVPPHWLPYTMVADCDVTAAKVVELGGKILMAPMDIEGVGRFAVIQDPQGGVSAIIKLTNM